MKPSNESDEYFRNEKSS